MRPDESNVSNLFSQQVVQYAIPHYQRPQAWSQEEQWEPLWADIESKANDWLSGVEPQQHYLGAIVMAKRPKPGVRGMDRSLVIDGQQRLSTLQYLLKALYFVCKDANYADGCLAIEGELFNKNEQMMDAPDIQRHKLWPTFRDRQAHASVMLATGVSELRQAFHAHFTKSGLLYQYGEHPRPLAATFFFYLRINEWLKGVPETERAFDAPEALRKAITRSLQLIILWLEDRDDPQVIFECLNGRGAPLKATDLIKNYIFMSAEVPQAGAAQEITEESPLFQSWRMFDQQRWLQEISRGRLKKSRLEWLVYYSLQAEMGEDIDSSKTFQAYKRWATSQAVDADAQVQMLVEHADNLLALSECDSGSPIGQFGGIAQAVDVTIVSPLALAIARNCDSISQAQMYAALGSYLVRREACGLTKKAYNQTFFAVLKELRKTGFSVVNLVAALQAMKGSSTVWPSDDQFRDAIVHRPLYRPINLARLLLTEAANTIGAARPGGETVWTPNWRDLHIEHLMPNSWFEHWPLPGGEIVLNETEAIRLSLLTDGDPRELVRNQVRTREARKNTLGNLTVLDGPLNIEIQNFAWPVKKGAIKAATQLRMNFDLVALSSWDETSIEQRSNELATILISRFPGPAAFAVL